MFILYSNKDDQRMKRGEHNSREALAQKNQWLPPYIAFFIYFLLK